MSLLQITTILVKDNCQIFSLQTQSASIRKPRKPRIKCFICHKKSHKANDCLRQLLLIPVIGKLRYVTAKGVKESPNAILSELIVNGARALVLFDLRAVCSYISSKFVDNNLSPWCPVPNP